MLLSKIIVVVTAIWLEYFLIHYYSKEVSFNKNIPTLRERKLYSGNNELEKYKDIVGVLLLILIGILGSTYIIIQS